MNNKAKIVLSMLLLLSGVSQFCSGSNIHTLDSIGNQKITFDRNKIASILYNKPVLNPKTKMVISWVRRISNGLGYFDQYAHGAVAAFALFCVAPWLASKGANNTAIKLAAS